MMMSYIEENHKTWDEHIYELTFAFNTAVHDSTGVSPAFLNLGRNPEIGHSVRRKEAEAALIAEEDEARIAWAMHMKNLSGIRDKATENSQRAQERQAQYYNKKRRDVTFKVNDRVLRRNRILSSSVKGIAAKLGRKFRVPCRVSKVLGSNVYQLIGEKGDLVEKVTASDLKPYYDKSSGAVSDERKSTTNDVTSDKLSINSNTADGERATKADIKTPKKLHAVVNKNHIRKADNKKKSKNTLENKNEEARLSAFAPRLTRAQAKKLEGITKDMSESHTTPLDTSKARSGRPES
ncbi:hypothetical protein TKK_0010187 [Trichogramma kaykai]